MAESALHGLKPEPLWLHFEALTRIPRCSGNEAAVSRHVTEWAKVHGFEPRQDETGNLVVRVPASEGKEGAPVVVLQGHLDMVGEKDSSSPHDFDHDPIRVLRDGDYLTADGTTLGSDNGVGLAAAMAVAEDPQAVHGPLELLFTISEETGLTGAQGLQPGFVSGETMLNLDSEEEGAVYVGCAGGVDSEVELPVSRQPGNGGEAHRITVHGLRGGHSGLDINTGRGNAIQVLAWFLQRLRERTGSGLQIVELAAGDKHNAIPREAAATVLLPAEGASAAEELLEPMRADLQAMFGKTDPGVAIEIAAESISTDPLTIQDRDRLLDLMLAMPHGVQAMSQAVEGLVETSTNLAVVRLERDRALFLQSTRSSVMPALSTVQGTIFAAARLAGAIPTSQGGYPGWQPDLDSAVLARAKSVHEKLFGKLPEVKAIHAGLECGIIGEKFGGMDMLSFGPQIENPHSPSERVKIDTVERFYRFLAALLEELAA